MNQQELLRRSAVLTAAHSDRYADRVEPKPEDSRLHDGASHSDYPEHHHLVSASPRVDDRLNRQLVSLIRRYQATLD